MVLYRLVKTRWPTPWDVMSDEAKGELPPADPDDETLEMWITGVGVSSSSARPPDLDPARLPRRRDIVDHDRGAAGFQDIAVLLGPFQSRLWPPISIVSCSVL